MQEREGVLGLVMIIVIVMTIAAPRAHADPKVEAQAHIDRATELFANNKPAEALDELKTAFALDPRPELLYAIGQAHSSMGQCPQAKTFFERFVATKPAPDLRQLAKDAIAACKDAPPPATEPEPDPKPEPKPEPEPTPEPPPAVELPPERPSPWYADVLGDVLVGAGLIAGGIAVFEYRSALRDRDRADDEAVYEDYVALRDSAERKRTYAAILGAGGVVLVGAGILRLILHDRGGHTPPVQLAPTSGGAAVTWTGRF